MSPKDWPDDATDQNWVLEIENDKLKAELELLRTQKVLWNGAAEELAGLYWDEHKVWPECISIPREMDPYKEVLPNE